MNRNYLIISINENITKLKKKLDLIEDLNNKLTKIKIYNDKLKNIKDNAIKDIKKNYETTFIKSLNHSIYTKNTDNTHHINSKILKPIRKSYSSEITSKKAKMNILNILKSKNSILEQKYLNYKDELNMLKKDENEMREYIQNIISNCIFKGISIIEAS